MNDLYSFYFRPFTLIAPAMMLGIIAGVYFPGQRTVAFFGVLACALCMLLRIVFHKKKPLFFLTLMSLCWGYFSIQSYVDPQFPPNHITHFTDKYKWLIVGKIEDTPIERDGSLKFVLQVEKLGRNTPITGKIKVTVIRQDVPENLHAGDTISFASKIKSLRNFGNPGGFDYERYMALKDIWGSAFVHKAVDILPEGTSSEINKKIAMFQSQISEIIEMFRNQISELIEDTGPGDHVGVLKALIIGNKIEISPSVRENFSRAGIAHILAISGLHIGMIGGFAYFMFRWLLSRFKFLLWRAWVRKGAAFLSFFPVLAYSLLAGMSYPTQRVIIIVAVFLLSLLFEKEQDGMNSLSLAAIATLILDPGSLFSVSFQLSFSSAFAIIYGNSKIPHGKIFAKKKGFKLTQKFFSFFSLSLFAIIGTLPFTMFHFGQGTLAGFFANFIFIPVIGFFVLPMGLLSVCLYPISSELASYCIHISAFGLSNTLDALIPSYFEIFGFYILIWMLLVRRAAVAGSDKSRTDDDAPQRISIGNLFNILVVLQKAMTLGPRTDNPVLNEMTKFFKSLRQNIRRSIADFCTVSNILTLIMLIVVLVNVCYWVHERFWHDDLRVTVIDVGQGSSALVELPGGQCFLIDGGGTHDNSAFDVGEKILAPFLLRKRIRTLDYIVLSHPDGDHLNGLLYILRNFNVKNVWTTGDESDSANYSEFLNIIEEKQIDPPDFGEIFGAHDKINGVQVEVLYPPEDFMENNETLRHEKNNNSMVLKFTFNGISFLFPGDIEAEAEKELVETAGDKLKSTVLIAPHHGSKTSSTETFLDAVKPEYVIISAGWQNKFYFPHPSVMKCYRERNCKILRTDEHGAISISAKGQKPVIEPYRKADENDASGE